MVNDKNSQPGIDELISLQEAAKISGFTDRHIRHLAVEGIIWAKKLGRNWFTTPKVIYDYLASQRKPGPKPK